MFHQIAPATKSKILQIHKKGAPKGRKKKKYGNKDEQKKELLKRIFKRRNLCRKYFTAIGVS